MMTKDSFDFPSADDVDEVGSDSLSPNESVSLGKGRFITFLITPDSIEQHNLPVLEKTYREVVADSTRSLVVNHDLRAEIVYVDPSVRLIVSAPGISASDLDKLSKRVNDPTSDIIAVNYLLWVQAVVVNVE